MVKNIYETVPNDESREMYKVPVLVEEMARRGWLGDKTGQGFYKRVKGEGEKEILTLDVQHDGVSAAAKSAICVAGNGQSDRGHAGAVAGAARSVAGRAERR